MVLMPQNVCTTVATQSGQSCKQTVQLGKKCTWISEYLDMILFWHNLITIAFYGQLHVQLQLIIFVILDYNSSGILSWEQATCI